MDKFEILNERLVALRKLSEELTAIDRKRQQHRLINKTIYVGNGLFAVERRLKMPEPTDYDYKKHARFLAELMLLFRTDDADAPVNVIKKEAELVNRLYIDLIQAFNDVLSSLSQK